MSDGERCPSNSLSLSNTMKYMHIKNINGCFNGAKMWKMDHRFLISDPDVSKVNHNMGQTWYSLYYGISAISHSQ